MSDDNGQKPDGEYDNITRLYIRTNPADTGSRPLAGGVPFWLSPDITIVRPGGIRGSEGMVGELDNVEVVVNNKGGMDAIDAYVEAFLADPSTSFTPATAMSVGAGFLTIPNHNLAAINFPWIPTPSDAGHRCMLARVCLSVPYDCYANPAIFDVQNDRHVAQRNLNVLTFEEDTISFAFLVVNPLKDKSAFVLRITEVSIGRNADFIRRALGCPFAQFGQEKLGGIGLTLGEPVPLIHDPGTVLKFPTGVLRAKMEVPRAKTVRLELGHKDRHYAVLTIARNPKIRSGDLNVVQVQQIEPETERIVGGLWLVVQH